MTNYLLKSSVKALLLLVASVTSLSAFGIVQEVTYNGVKYKSDKKVTYLKVVAAPYSGDIVIASSVEVLGEQIPVTEIGSSAFSECDDLISVTIPESVKKIGDYAFDSSTKLKTVNMGNGVESIGHWAFRNCYELENLKLSEKLKTIGHYCFDKNLKLTEVTLPASLTNIGGYAFEGNPQLKTVYCLGAVPPAVKKGYLDGEELYTIFDDNDYGDRVLYVPAGKKDDYKLTYGWNQFKDIREIESGISANEVAQKQVEVAPYGKNAIVVTAAEAMTVRGYDIMGRALFVKNVEAGQTVIDNVNSGLIIVAGQKVVVE